MSYAQPSPPKIHCDLLTKNPSSFFIALASSLSSFFKAALTFSALSLVPSLSSLFSSHSLKTDLTSWLMSLSNAFSILLAILSLTALTPKYIPSPYSALSSNNEFAHAGP